MEDTKEKMDTLFEKLVVGRDKGFELQSNIEFYMQCVKTPNLYGNHAAPPPSEIHPKGIESILKTN